MLDLSLNVKQPNFPPKIRLPSISALSQSIPAFGTSIPLESPTAIHTPSALTHQPIPPIGEFASSIFTVPSSFIPSSSQFEGSANVIRQQRINPPNSPFNTSMMMRGDEVPPQSPIFSEQHLFPIQYSHNAEHPGFSTSQPEAYPINYYPQAPYTARAQQQPCHPMKTHDSKLKPQLYCQRCGITDTPEWRKGPNGSRTLCNACGLFHAKLLKREGPKVAAAAVLSGKKGSRRAIPRRPMIETSDYQYSSSNSPRVNPQFPAMGLAPNQTPPGVHREAATHQRHMSPASFQRFGPFTSDNKAPNHVPSIQHRSTPRFTATNSRREVN